MCLINLITIMPVVVDLKQAQMLVLINSIYFPGPGDLGPSFPTAVTDTFCCCELNNMPQYTCLMLHFHCWCV